MKIFVAAIVGIFSLSFAVTLGPENVSAQQQFNPKNEIQVTGRVLPMHSVVVDSNGIVLEILSNTYEDVLPRVFVDRISLETEIPLNDAVKTQYNALVPQGSSKVGSLYKKPPIKIEFTKVEKPDLYQPF